MSDDITMDQLCPNSNQKSSANLLLNDVYRSGYKDSLYLKLNEQVESIGNSVEEDSCVIKSANNKSDQLLIEN